MSMLDGNTAALRRYLDDMDKAEAMAPSEAQVREKQEQMYWDRLHDLDALCEAMDPSEWGDMQTNLLILVGEELAHARATEDGEEKHERWAEAGRLLASLMGSRLYPSASDAEYELRNQE